MKQPLGIFTLKTHIEAKIGNKDANSEWEPITLYCIENNDFHSHGVMEWIAELASKNGIYCLTQNFIVFTITWVKFCSREKEEHLSEENNSQGAANACNYFTNTLAHPRTIMHVQVAALETGKVSKNYETRYFARKDRA